MLETMIERVADAIMRADDGNPAYREIYLRSARAAIEAMLAVLKEDPNALDRLGDDDAADKP